MRARLVVPTRFVLLSAWRVASIVMRDMNLWNCIQNGILGVIVEIQSLMANNVTWKR